jgi:hypothetical protein
MCTNFESIICGKKGKYNTTFDYFNRTCEKEAIDCNDFQLIKQSITIRRSADGKSSKKSQTEENKN